jgi:hypothetical protein
MKTTTENLSELQAIVYNAIKEQIESKQYEVTIYDDCSSNVTGYIKGDLVFLGQKIPTSFNKKGFCCFHVDGILGPVFNLFTDEEEKRISDEAFALFKQNRTKNMKQIKHYKEQIEDYKKKLASLEQAMED